MKNETNKTITKIIEHRDYGVAVYSNCPKCGLEVRIGGFRNTSEIPEISEEFLISLCEQQNIANPECHVNKLAEVNDELKKEILEQIKNETKGYDSISIFINKSLFDVNLKDPKLISEIKEMLLEETQQDWVFSGKNLENLNFDKVEE